MKSKFLFLNFSNLLTDVKKTRKDVEGSWRFKRVDLGEGCTPSPSEMTYGLLK